MALVMSEPVSYQPWIEPQERGICAAVFDAFFEHWFLSMDEDLTLAAFCGGGPLDRETRYF